MFFIFYFIYTCLLIFLSIALVNIIWGPFLKKKQNPTRQTFVSVLIPARNEEKNIAGCLQSLLAQNYENFEIRVLDDESSDRTSVIAKEFANQNPAILVHSGEALPPGWTGKNWACHQLSQQAKGDILIFTDADNRFQPDAICHTIGWMQRYQLDMFSVFPQQITNSFFEKLIVPVIDLLLYASLILWLTYHSRFSSLAAANGQWIAFQRTAYQKIGGHQTVSQQIVEDVELSRLAKRKGLRILTGAGTGTVYGHMYHSASEVWEGFSKNLFGLVSNRVIPFFIILAGLSVVYILPYIMIFFRNLLLLSSIAIGLNLLLRLLLAIRYKHPIIMSTLLHPVAIFITILIGLNSFRKISWGKISWKDRQIKIK